SPHAPHNTSTRTPRHGGNAPSPPKRSQRHSGRRSNNETPESPTSPGSSTTPTARTWQKRTPDSATCSRPSTQTYGRCATRTVNYDDPSTLPGPISNGSGNVTSRSYSPTPPPTPPEGVRVAHRVAQLGSGVDAGRPPRSKRPITVASDSSNRSRGR